MIRLKTGQMRTILSLSLCVLRMTSSAHPEQRSGSDKKVKKSKACEKTLTPKWDEELELGREAWRRVPPKGAKPAGRPRRARCDVKALATADDCHVSRTGHLGQPVATVLYKKTVLNRLNSYFERGCCAAGMPPSVPNVIYVCFVSFA